MLPDGGQHHREKSGQSMRGLFTSAHSTIFNFGHDMREAVQSHFGNHIGGSLSGIYVRLPFTCLSVFLEWREQSIGLGHSCADGHLEVFAWRFQGIFCVEPKDAW